MILIRRRPALVKNSLLPSLRGPSVSPSSAYTKIKSISDETFSSPPPSLPMPMTSNSCGLKPDSPSGRPNCSRNAGIKQLSACRTHTSASAVMACITSFKSARPLRSRRISLTITCLRNMRKARVNSASSSRFRPVCCNKASISKRLHAVV